MTEAVSHTFPAQVQGHYVVQAPTGPGPQALLVGFHGYGQSAQQHLADLRRLPGASGHVLVAVQALHRFYSKGGDVVGSWMTRLGREQAIVDNIRYVSDVVARVRGDFPQAGALVYAGFSQGAAMAYRAAARSGHACRALLVLGGDLPPDVAADGQARLPAVFVARGARDTWFTDEKLQNDLTRLAALHTEVSSLVFDGAHEWTDEFCREAGAFLQQTLGRLPN